ncbi:hypothetical protein HDV05_004615 [Chytridiales sp. JEL 0842]|nr:hypothetical protein HDV05_004615 [Chytridiales sp. JEL 0842]
MVKVTSLAVAATVASTATTTLVSAASGGVRVSSLRNPLSGSNGATTFQGGHFKPFLTATSKGAIEHCRTILTKAGDTWLSLATANSLSVAQLQKMNPYVPRGSLPVDELICVQRFAPDCTQRHTSQSGESCMGIAYSYQMTLDQLITYNPEVDCWNLAVSTELCVNVEREAKEYKSPPAVVTPPAFIDSVVTPPPVTPSASAESNNTLNNNNLLSTRQPEPIDPTQGCTAFYIVRPGETCADITVQTRLAFSELIKYNHNFNCADLTTGQILCTSTDTSIGPVVPLPASNVRISFTSSPPASQLTASTQDSTLTPEMQLALEAHNAERALYNLPTLSWSPLLSTSASGIAEALVEQGCSIHNSELPLGENIWAFSSNYKPHDSAWSVERAVRDWIRGNGREREGYNPLEASYGHWSQIVWRDSERVGCGKAGRLNGEGVFCGVVVCHYDPRGNFEGENPLAGKVGKL